MERKCPISICHSRRIWLRGFSLLLRVGWCMWSVSALGEGTEASQAPHGPWGSFPGAVVGSGTLRGPSTPGDCVAIS